MHHSLCLDILASSNYSSSRQVHFEVLNQSIVFSEWKWRSKLNNFWDFLVWEIVLPHFLPSKCLSVLFSVFPSLYRYPSWLSEKLVSIFCQTKSKCQFLFTIIFQKIHNSELKTGKFTSPVIVAIVFNVNFES